jgi:hypothetical protein
MPSRSSGRGDLPADDLRLGLEGCEFGPRFEAVGPGRRAVRVVVSLNLRRLQFLNQTFGFDYGDAILEELGGRLTETLIAARDQLRGKVDLSAGRAPGGYVVLIDADRPRDADIVAGRCVRTDHQPCGDPPSVVQWFAVSVLSDPSANSLSMAYRAFQEHRHNHVELYLPGYMTGDNTVTEWWDGPAGQPRGRHRS